MYSSFSAIYVIKNLSMCVVHGCAPPLSHSPTNFNTWCDPSYNPFRWNTNLHDIPLFPIMIPRFSLYIYCLYLVYGCPMNHDISKYVLKGELPPTEHAWWGPSYQFQQFIIPPIDDTQCLLDLLVLVYGCPIMHGCFLRGNFLPLNMHDVALPTHSVGIPTHYSL